MARGLWATPSRSTSTLRRRELFNKRDLLYGFPQVAQAVGRERAALIVEGYTDVLMLYQSGIKNAVATLGTATTPSHLKTLSGYVDRIYMLFDPDAAGERALERADATVQELERTNNTDDADAAVEATRLKLDLRVLRLSADPADWLLEHSAEEFRAMLASQAMPLLEYIFRARRSGRGAPMPPKGPGRCRRSGTSSSGSTTPSSTARPSVLPPKLWA